MTPPTPTGMIAGIVEAFLKGPLSIIVIVASLLLGAIALTRTPREEEPQIVVPMADILVEFPGHSPAEVEQLVTTPLERLLWQIDGVEHVYSISRRDSAAVMVRFLVGQDRERSMVRITDKIAANLDLVPPGVKGWLVRPVEIDDVPIVTLTLFSPSRDAFELRRVAEELKARLDSVKDISRTEIFGGYPRQLLVEPRIEDMAGRSVTIDDLTAALTRANLPATAGATTSADTTAALLVKPGLCSAADVARVVVATHKDAIVRVEDVATVTDGPREQTDYARIGFGPSCPEAQKSLRGASLPAVTIAFSKKKGTNAIATAEEVIRRAGELRQKVAPADVEMLVTRNYGKLADQKVNELIEGMLFAIITVIGLITFTMGWREGLVVGLSVPVSFALALFVNLLFGYTINRVTLFALILSLGLVVDDPIMNVDNIQRHIRLGLLDPFHATLRAVHEVLPPVIVSTLAIIICFLPMFFITGMMGPYMGPMAINVPLTVTFSLLCALTFVPWLAYHLLKGSAAAAGSAGGHDVTPAWIRRLYRAVVSPFLEPRKAFILLAVVVGLLAGSGALMLFGVPLKMLPFDNKDELQLVVRMPEGTSLERTARAVSDLESRLAAINEVADFESYVGLNAPVDFNGLVRHYGFRREPHQADIRVNLAPKHKRKQQSHSIALRIRDELTAVAKTHGAALEIVEIPPGPPVLATIVAELRGGPSHSYAELVDAAKLLRKRMTDTDAKHLAQIDDYSEAPHNRVAFTVDTDKAALHGLAVGDVTATLRTALAGSSPGIVHIEHERTPTALTIRLPFDARSSTQRLGELQLRGKNGAHIQLAELGAFTEETEEQPVYHKNLERVVFVTAETVGRTPAEMILAIWKTLWRNPLPAGFAVEWAGEGEWEVTLRVFRDLGIAFGVALVGIYLLMVAQTGSFLMPLIIMTAIPLTIIGIAPGFFLLNVLTGRQIGGYSDPVFFTATGMIGMIALGGIVIRNSVVLIEFIQDALRKGADLKEAILESGAVRFRPIALTAVTAMLGAWPITLDPVFSGLAWALIFGLAASTAFTLIVIPTVYMLVGPRKV